MASKTLDKSKVIEIVEKFNQMMNQCANGNGVQVVDMQENPPVVRVRLLNRCTECPGKLVTLKLGLERMICYQATENTTVEEVIEPVAPPG